MKHLVFQVAASLMSFGGAGAKQERATDSYPGKGLALGLLGAALGKKRDDPWHDLSKRFGFAVLTVRAGHRLEDYHTVATPRGTATFNTRLEEVEAADYTVETWRGYISDGYFVIAFWGMSDADLEEAVDALVSPTFEIFAGRKSCPLSLPMAPEIVDCETLREVFRRYSKKIYQELRPQGKEFPIHWEPHQSPGIDSQRVYLRKDQIENRALRLFRERSEHEGVLAI